MDSENLLSWNLPNFVSIALMMVIIWVVLGFGSHLLRRKAVPRGVVQTPANGGLMPV